MRIVRPITDDGLVGFDEQGHFVHCTVDGDYRTFVGIVDVRRETCVICDRGWEETSASLHDQASWPLTKGLVHRSCLIRHEGLLERQGAWDAIVGAKMRFGGLLTMPNGYWRPPDPWAKKPWYYAELLDHPVKILLGSRKRVLNIEFHPQGGTKLEWAQEAEEAFRGEDVTKEFSECRVLLHAWGAEKMKRYVKDIAELAGYARKEAP
jgi:hypothetical protein